MPKHAQVRVRRWHATVILTLFLTAVAGAAALGWWYARDSPPHQGPIVLISVDGLSRSLLAAYGAAQGGMPGIDALAADSVVFDRAYAHSPQLLPAFASVLSGRLPFEHGIRDDSGFGLARDVRTLAELLRNRGFDAGAAVTSPLIRRETGVARGFSFFDAPLPPDALALTADPDAPDGPDGGSRTLDAAEAWAVDQDDQRYFLLVHVEAHEADGAVTRVIRLLEDRGAYDRSTIVFLGSRGRAGADASLDEDTLLVPLLVKQPQAQGAGWHVTAPVQQIDLVPTLLDLVRAPIPGGLDGRSLRSVLTDEDGRIAPQPVYAESLAAYYRFGGHPLFALTVNHLRYVRGASETLVRLPTAGDAVPAAPPVPSGGVTPAGAQDGEEVLSDDMSPLRATLDRLLAGQQVGLTARTTGADRDWLARTGYLQGLRRSSGAGDPVVPADLTVQEQLLDAHEGAARLLGERRHAAALHALQAQARSHPTLADLHYQIGVIALAAGFQSQAIAALREAAARRPDAPEPPAALASALARVGRHDDARVQAELAVTLAAGLDAEAVAAAHETAARVALARGDTEAAMAHAVAVQTARPGVPMAALVRGTVLAGEGRDEEAAALLREGAGVLRQHETALEGLHLHLGDVLARLGRTADAEAAYREEARAFPDAVPAYTGLSALVRSNGRIEDADAILDVLLRLVPTPDGYAAAARAWTAAGQRARAERVRSEARARLRGADPRPVRPARDTAR